MAISADTLVDLLKNTFGEFEKVIKDSYNPSKILSQMADVDTAASKVANTFGLGREQVIRISAGLTEAVTQVTLMGGSFEKVVEMQKAVGETLGRNVLLSSDSVEKLFATTQVTSKSALELIVPFRDIGISTDNMVKNMETAVLTSRQIGVSAAAVSSQVVANLSLLNQYSFQGGVDGLSKMAAQAVNLRFNIKDVSQAIEKSFNPETAINMAAGLQRLGVAQSSLLDPLKLMDMSQNDPAELQNQIVEMTKSMVHLNEKGDFEILPGEKRRLAEIAKEMGMSVDTLAKMGTGAAELERKMGQIKFNSGINEDDKKMIANMAEMKDGEYRIKFEDKEGKVQEKSVTQLDDKDIQQITEAQSRAPKTMEDIAKSQLSTLSSIDGSIRSIATTGYGISGTKGAKDTMDIGRGTVNVAGDFSRAVNIFGNDTKKMSGNFNEITKSVGSLADVLTSDKSIKESFVTLGETGKILTTTLQDNLNVAAKNASIQLDLLSQNGNSFATFFKTTVEKIGQIPGVKGAASENQQIKVKDFTINTLPEDKLVMAGGTKLDENTQNTNVKSEPVTLNLNLKIDAPSHVDTDKIIESFKNQSVMQEMVMAINRARNDNGMISQINPLQSYSKTA